MTSLEKNTVPSYNQLKGAPSCYLLNPESTGTRVLFLGNSITLHGIAPHLGWNNLCGMAASSAEKDYVHLCMKEILEIDSEATFALAQIADWERNFMNGSSILNEYSACREFDADIIIFRAVENCPANDFKSDVFQKELKLLLEYFNPNKKAKYIITQGFWRHPADSSIKAVAEDLNSPLVPLGDLGDDDNMKAINEYEHGGVAQHPNDNGMAHIAKRIIETLIASEMLK